MDKKIAYFNSFIIVNYLFLYSIFSNFYNLYCTLFLEILIFNLILLLKKVTLPIQKSDFTYSKK